jgi:hypothetical protein
MDRQTRHKELERKVKHYDRPTGAKESAQPQTRPAYPPSERIAGAVDKLHGADSAPSPSERKSYGDHSGPPESPNSQRRKIGFAQCEQFVVRETGTGPKTVHH